MKSMTLRSALLLLSMFVALQLAAHPLVAAEPFTVLAGKDAAAPKQPQACVANDGSVHVTFGVGERVYYCRLEDGRATEPVAAFRVPNMSLGMRRGPRIAHSGSAITITAIGGAQGKGKDGDILAYRSVDAGKTWLGPVRVNDVESSAREGLHAMTSDPQGVLWSVWLDLREKGTRLFAAKSTDQGATWSKNFLVYKSPERAICECCHPSIVADGKSVQVLFRNSLSGDRDMYLVATLDQGQTMGEAVRLGTDHWKLNACPMDGGMLALHHGEVSTIWRRDRTIVMTSGKGAAEKSLGPGEQPWIASNSRGAYAVWTSKRGGDLLAMKPAGNHAVKLGSEASFPVVVASPLKDGAVFAFWEKQTGPTMSIVGQRLDQ